MFPTLVYLLHRDMTRKSIKLILPPTFNKGMRRTSMLSWVERSGSSLKQCSR